MTQFQTELNQSINLFLYIFNQQACSFINLFNAKSCPLILAFPRLLHFKADRAASPLQSGFPTRFGLKPEISRNVFLRLFGSHDLSQQCSDYSKMVDCMERSGIYLSRGRGLNGLIPPLDKYWVQ